MNEQIIPANPDHFVARDDGRATRIFPVLLWITTRDGTINPVFPAGLGEQGLLLLDDGDLLDEDTGEQFTTVSAAREHYAIPE